MTQKNIFDHFRSIDGGERLLPRRELRNLVPVSDMTIWRWERDGQFPRHLSINSRNYWRFSEISDWIDRKKKGEGPAHPVGRSDQ